jgi:3-hydroxyacyl-CoA dehydrogenase
MNPVNRLAALLGLVAIGLIAYGVATGSLGMVDAATRAGLTFGAVVVVRAIGRIGLSALAGSMERQAGSEPRRRATDKVADKR